MEPARLSRPIICLALAACAAALPSTAQESLDTVLDRGYIRQWLVCGPFKPDVAGGIVAALERGEAPLGDTDFMDPLGGIGRVRPKHLLKVETDDGVAIWQMAGATDETLDLAPFFPDAREGLSYAGFYAKAATPRTVYLDVQSPLGVRIFFNGFPARAIRPAPITATGVDRFTLVFRAGLNLLVMEVPGATFEALAELDNTGASEFKARALMNRPLLTGKSGFEIGLRILPLEEFGPIAYVPRLASSGTFSGWAEDPRQDVTVTLFNPLPVMSPPIILEAQAGEAGPATTATVPGVPPESQREVILGIPTGDLSSGQALRVNVSIEAEGEKTSFMGSVNVLPRPRDGKVYFITGLRYRPESPEDQRTATQRLMEECARHMALLTEEPDYGFDLGPIHLWKAFVTAHPAQRSAVRYAVGMSRCAPRAGYGHPDERLVCGELLVRNLAYGRIAAERLLGDAGMSFDAWGLSGVCPQLPQLVAGAGLAGVVSNLPVRGVPEFFWHEGLDNTRVLHRRKTPSGGPRSLRDLRDMVAVQRRELLERGIPSDLLISESVVTPPEPFFLGACERLGRSVPAIMVTGAGGGELFADTRELVLRGAAELPVAARAMNAVRLGELLAQPDLKRAHAELEADLCAAEMFATFAALFGAEYPESALDLAWRHLMYASAPERLGFAPTPRAYVDALAAYREAAEYANAVLDRSMAYLAERADVYANAPSPSENVLALVVFNASSMQRTDVCEARAALPSARGLALLDDAGARVAFLADRIRVSNERLVGVRLRFVATDVPPLGYRTYYLRLVGALSKPSKVPGAQIENDYFRVLIDASSGGAISSLVAKGTGTEYAAGLLNDIVAIAEDGAANDFGRGIWTTGDVARASKTPADVTVEKSPDMERATITTAFHGGTLIREITLYRGVARVDCATRIEGVSTEDTMLAATFGSASEGRVPVFGERFGALVGRKSVGQLDYRTRAGENASGTGAHPALRWAVLSPNDGIQVALEASAPFGPATIIYGAEPGLERAALGIQSVLVNRGIPCSVSADETRKLNTIWTDSTEFPNFDDDLYYGVAMRIVVGNEDQNLICRRLLRQLPELERVRFRGRVEKGAPSFMHDEDVPAHIGAVPTLILAGDTVEGTIELARAFADSVRVNGVYGIPSEAFLPPESRPRPNTGMAILFSGSTLASVERDGTLVLGLCHGSRWPAHRDAPDVPPMPAVQSFRYAIYPFAGTWREANVPQVAHAYSVPLRATVTELRAGSERPSQSFLRPERPGFIVSAVKPIGYRRAAMSRRAYTPRDGIVVRACDPRGTEWEGNVRFFATLRDVWRMDLLGRPTDKVAFNEDVAILRVGRFEIASLAFRPTSGIARGPNTDLAISADAHGPIFTRYWMHNPGAAPMDFQPLSLVIEGGVGGSAENVRVTVANMLTDEPIQGTVLLTAAAGSRVAPSEFDYDLEPGAHLEQEVVLVGAAAASGQGGLVAATRYKDQTYQDVLDATMEPVDLEVSRRGNEIRVVVTNRSALPASGYVDLIAPPAHWPELGQEPEVAITPRRAGVYAGAYQQQRLMFRASAAEPLPWMVVKLAANGHVVYKRVPE